MGALGREHTDEEIGRHDMRGDDIFIIPPEVWPTVRKQVKDLLDAAELGGITRSDPVACMSGTRMVHTQAGGPPCPPTGSMTLLCPCLAQDTAFGSCVTCGLDSSQPHMRRDHVGMHWVVDPDGAQLDMHRVRHRRPSAHHVAGDRAPTGDTRDRCSGPQGSPPMSLLDAALV